MIMLKFYFEMILSYCTKATALFKIWAGKQIQSLVSVLVIFKCNKNKKRKGFYFILF